MVSLFVFGKEDKVVAAAVDDTLASRLRVAFLDGGVLVVECTLSTVCLNADDGFKELKLYTIQFRLAFLAFFGGGLLIIQCGLASLDFILDFAVVLIDIIHKLLDTKHVAMIGKRHGEHTVGDTFLDKLVDLGHSIKNREVGVDV